MNVNLGIWDKLTKAAMLLLFAAGAMAVGVWYKPQIEKNEALRKTLLQLDDQIRKEEEGRKWLKGAVDACSSDPRTIERLAREALGFGRPGEVIIRFEDPRR